MNTIYEYSSLSNLHILFSIYGISLICDFSLSSASSLACGAVHPLIVYRALPYYIVASSSHPLTFRLLVVQSSIKSRGKNDHGDMIARDTVITTTTATGALYW